MSERTRRLTYHLSGHPRTIRYSYYLSVMSILHSSFFTPIVWIVPFHESLMPSCLVLGYLLLGVSEHSLVRLDVAGYAEQTAVGWIVGESLHLLYALATLYWYDMVHVHTRRVDTLLKAFLAQSVGALEHLSSQHLPSLIVQQLLVSWVSAHCIVSVDTCDVSHRLGFVP